MKLLDKLKNALFEEEEDEQLLRQLSGEDEE